jgi:hypothetical protein
MRVLLVVLAAACLEGCATADVAFDCSTDTECELLCVSELREDEDPAVCAISLAPVND